jgi:hypothetical protein
MDLITSSGEGVGDTYYVGPVRKSWPQSLDNLFQYNFPYMALRPFVEPWPLFQFRDPYTVGRTPWTGYQPVSRPLPTQDNTNRINARKHPCLKWDSNLPIPVFERAKTVHALGRVLRGSVEHVCPHGEEVHARKWKLYASTQDSPLDGATTAIGCQYI